MTNITYDSPSMFTYEDSTYGYTIGKTIGKWWFNGIVWDSPSSNQLHGVLENLPLPWMMFPAGNFHEKKHGISHLAMELMTQDLPNLVMTHMAIENHHAINGKTH